MRRLKVNGKRLAAGCLGGALLALLSPWLMLTELFASVPLVMLPAIGLTVIHRQSGRLAAGISSLLMLLSFGYFTGANFMWAVFLLILNPLSMLLRLEGKPFFEQLRYALTGFILGLAMAVLLFYIAYGGNLIEQMIAIVPDMLHGMPAGAIEEMLATMPGIAVRDAAGFLGMVDRLFAQLTQNYSVYLPGRLFSGAIITAVLCTIISNRLQRKAGLAKPGCYVPMARWYMPDSMSGGLVMILLISYAMMRFGLNGGKTVFYTVYEITVWAFVFQALASISRRLDGALPVHGVKIFLLCMLLAIALFGGAPYIAVYGFVSALMGEKGSLRRFMEQKSNKKDNDDSESGND